VKFGITAILMVAFSIMFALASSAEFVILFDEDVKAEAGAGNFAPLLVTHDAGSTVTITKDSAISGKVSAFCTPSQSYNPAMAGFSFPIDKYPYLTFAWKKDGGTGIMLQLNINGVWYRYFSGVNVTNWVPAIQLENDIPKDWILYTRDLAKDFGAKGWNLTGLALTPWDGKGGYYDHMMMHSKPDEGKITAKAVEAKNKLSTVWAKIKQQ
jgi:hypothetical protein